MLNDLFNNCCDFNFSEEEQKKQKQANIEYEKYIQKRINNGEIDGNGQPLKCPYCGSKEFDTRNEIFQAPHGTIEFEQYCVRCNKKIGYWAYGSWIE